MMRVDSLLRQGLLVVSVGMLTSSVAFSMGKGKRGGRGQQGQGIQQGSQSSGLSDDANSGNGGDQTPPATPSQQVDDAATRRSETIASHLTGAAAAPVLPPPPGFDVASSPKKRSNAEAAGKVSPPALPLESEETKPVSPSSSPKLDAGRKSPLPLALGVEEGKAAPRAKASSNADQVNPSAVSSSSELYVRVPTPVPTELSPSKTAAPKPESPKAGPTVSSIPEEEMGPAPKPRAGSLTASEKSAFSTPTAKPAVEALPTVDSRTETASSVRSGAESPSAWLRTPPKPEHVESTPTPSETAARNLEGSATIDLPAPSVPAKSEGLEPKAAPVQAESKLSEQAAASSAAPSVPTKSVAAPFEPKHVPVAKPEGKSSEQTVASSAAPSVPPEKPTAVPSSSAADAQSKPAAAPTLPKQPAVTPTASNPPPRRTMVAAPQQPQPQQKAPEGVQAPLRAPQQPVAGIPSTTKPAPLTVDSSSATTTRREDTADSHRRDPRVDEDEILFVGADFGRTPPSGNKATRWWNGLSKTEKGGVIAASVLVPVLVVGAGVGIWAAVNKDKEGDAVVDDADIVEAFDADVAAEHIHESVADHIHGAEHTHAVEEGAGETVLVN